MPSLLTGVAKGEAPLPAGWLKFMDTCSGKYFYASASTKAASWQRPPENAMLPGAPTLGQTGALPGAPVTPGTPLFGAPGTPTFGMPGSVTFGAVGSFTFGCPGSPTFGMAGSPTFGALGSATYGMLKSKKMNGKRILTPVYSAPSAPPPMKSSAMRAAQQAALVNNEADPIFL